MVSVREIIRRSASAYGNFFPTTNALETFFHPSVKIREIGEDFGKNHCFFRSKYKYQNVFLIYFLVTSSNYAYPITYLHK